MGILRHNEKNYYVDDDVAYFYEAAIAKLSLKIEAIKKIISTIDEQPISSQGFELAICCIKGVLDI